MLKKIKRIFTIIIALLFIFTPFLLSVFAIKKYFPEDYNLFENKVKLFVVQKVPILDKFFSIPKKSAPKKNDDFVKMPEPIEESLNYFTNEDVYNAICEYPDKIKPKDKFIGCNRCPKSLDTRSSDYFGLISYATGSVVKKDETESVFFMHGCIENQGNIAIVLRKGFGGWHRVSQFKNVSFDESPLVFKDPEGFLILIGKRKKIMDNFDNETLFSLTFKGNKEQSKDYISLQSKSSLQCSYQFLANMDTPQLESEHKFSIKIDVLGWQKETNSDCKIPTKNNNVHLKPGMYTLHFTQTKDNFEGDKTTQRIMTELEKSQE